MDLSLHFLQALLLSAQVHLLPVASCPPSVGVYFWIMPPPLFFPDHLSSSLLLYHPLYLTVHLFVTHIFNLHDTTWFLINACSPLSPIFHFVFVYPHSPNNFLTSLIAILSSWACNSQTVCHSQSPLRFLLFFSCSPDLCFSICFHKEKHWQLSYIYFLFRSIFRSYFIDLCLIISNHFLLITEV